MMTPDAPFDHPEVPIGECMVFEKNIILDVYLWILLSDFFHLWTFYSVSNENWANFTPEVGSSDSDAEIEQNGPNWANGYEILPSSEDNTTDRNENVDFPTPTLERARFSMNVCDFM